MIRHGRPHDARMASDHDDPDPLDVQTLKVAGIVIACVIGCLVILALAASF